MLGPPVDAWYAFVALSIASTVIAGVGLQLSTAAAPSATPVADTIDDVAAGPVASVGRHPVTADQVRIGTQRIAVDRDGHIDEATYRFGPVVPVTPHTDLADVLAGEPPEQTFDSKTAFNRALEQARTRTPYWQSVEHQLMVRSVAWDGTNVTLVGVA